MSQEPVSVVAVPALLAGLGVVVSYSAVWRRAADGLIPSHRKGRFVVIKPEDLPGIAQFFKDEAASRVNRGGRRKPHGYAAPRRVANSESYAK